MTSTGPATAPHPTPDRVAKTSVENLMTQDHSRPAHSRPRRTASAILATTLIWSQLAQVAVAVPTDLADTPMATAGRAKPNLIFVVDDSGSMGTSSI